MSISVLQVRKWSLTSLNINNITQWAGNEKQFCYLWVWIFFSLQPDISCWIPPLTCELKFRYYKNFKYLNNLPHSWENIYISNLFPVIDWYLEMEGLPGWCSSKDSACQCRRCKRWGFDPWIGKIPWRRICNPLQYSWPRKSHGQRSLG